ncbi:ParB/RepB/Spo0J family partition protein [Lachnospiraceae bacterium MD329]|nr:ParB/RepB/Spo0J family partition protein [Lachnospiraceae bacterium MD329]
MASEEKIQLMPLGEIKPYEDAPFKVRLDENMEELVESIKENGVLVPAIARPHTDGGVEMLAGHRRLKACELAGLDKLPVIVKNLDDDTAIILLVDSNLHREDILPSEKAYAYQMKLEAMKRQGKRSDLTCEQVAYKSDKGIITADMCDSITDKNLEGKIIVIEANTLRPEYRTQAHQIVRCTGGNGARPDARGSAVFCEYLYKDKNTRFERYDVLGILKKEHYPEWLTKRLEFEKAIKGNTVFEYGGYHFLPVGIVNVANPFKYISNHTISDKSLGIWSNKYNDRYGKNKIDYTHKGFYNACNKTSCDVFKCLENSKVYIPAENELFEYTGEYKAYEEKAAKTKSKKHKDMER